MPRAKLDNLHNFFKQLRCRVLFGHLMVCFGVEDRGRDKADCAWYGCVRCGRCERVDWVWDKQEMHWSERN